MRKKRGGKKPSSGRDKGSAAKKSSSSRRPRGQKPLSKKSRPQGRAVPGVHSVTELFRVRPHSISSLWIKESLSPSVDVKEILSLAEVHAVEVVPVSSQSLNEICQTHQGLVAFSEEAPEVTWAELERASSSICVCLDDIQDPHNVGAILRSSWLLGVQAVFTSSGGSSLLSPSACKVACGGAEHVPLDYHGSLPNILKQLKSIGFWIWGLDMGGPYNIHDSELVYPEKVVWVVGNEGSGIRKSVRGICDEIVSIKQTVDHASFNASVATAMALSETVRRSSIR